MDLGGAKPVTGVAMQRVEQHPLRLIVVGVVRGVLGEAPGVADRDPVRGAVARAGEARSIDERLGQHHRVTVHRAPVLGQAAQIQRQHPQARLGTRVLVGRTKKREFLAMRCKRG